MFLYQLFDVCTRPKKYFCDWRFVHFSFLFRLTVIKKTKKSFTNYVYKIPTKDLCSYFLLLQRCKYMSFIKISCWQYYFSNIFGMFWFYFRNIKINIYEKTRFSTSFKFVTTNFLKICLINFENDSYTFLWYFYF